MRVLWGLTSGRMKSPSSLSSTSFSMGGIVSKRATFISSFCEKRDTYFSCFSRMKSVSWQQRRETRHWLGLALEGFAHYLEFNAPSGISGRTFDKQTCKWPCNSCLTAIMKKLSTHKTPLSSLWNTGNYMTFDKALNSKATDLYGSEEASKKT